MTNTIRSATPCPTAFSRASCSASSDTSIAITITWSAILRRRSAASTDTPIAPVPVPTSTTRSAGAPGTRGVAVRRATISSIAASTRSSVSGRGMRARESVANASPWNSRKPRMYATGSPRSRRSTATSNAWRASGPTGASGWARTPVRSMPSVWPRSSSASSRADPEPDAAIRSAATRTSSDTVTAASAIGPTSGS